MARRYYSSTAVATTLSASANNSTTSITVTALSGFPVSTPWTAIIDADTASEEVVEVTSVSGTTLTVTRGVDGTSAVSHSAGAVFRHGVSARDFDEPNEFINTSSRVTFADTQPSSPADGEIWIDSDSTAATLNPNDYVANALIANSKGALITSTGSAVDDLTVGADGTVLTADSGETLGIKWAAVGGGKDDADNIIAVQVFG